MHSLSSFLIFAVISFPAKSITLEQVLLQDVFMDHSPKCNASLSSSTFNFHLDLKGKPYFNNDFAEEEEVLFLAEIEHISENSNQSWRFRIGQGGNVYSYHGPIGEVMPPNVLAGQYMVDEVWQTVVVDTNLNNPDGRTKPASDEKYFIHQAGPYQKDTGWTDVKPYFFSPNLAFHCDTEERECLFATWGQHGHVPTDEKSGAIYHDRYRDCGDGVIEHTHVVHNSEDPLTSSVEYNYMSFPWFGVNNQVLKDVLLTSTAGYKSRTWPPPIFSGNVRYELEFTAGYIVFAEDVLLPYGTKFTMPGYWDVGEASYPDVVFRNLGRGDSSEKTCEHFPGHTKYVGIYSIRCALLTEISLNSGCKLCPMTFTNLETQESVDVSHVQHWSYYTTTIDTRHVYFSLLSNGENLIDADYVSNMFQNGSEVVLSWRETGKPDTDNAAMALVHGNDPEKISEKFNYFHGPGRFFYGDAFSLERKYMVFNEVQVITMTPGSTFGRRQYIITDKLDNMEAKASSWVPEAIQEFYDLGDLPTTPIELVCNLDGTSFGASFSGEICTGSYSCYGSSTPQPGLKAHYQITCGDEKYFGTDLYHFSSFDNSTGFTRPYACSNVNGILRPSFKLFGYFNDNECFFAEHSNYDDNYCSKEGKESNSPSDNPTLSPTTPPTTTPTSGPTSSETFPPTASFTDPPTISYTNPPTDPSLQTLPPTASFTEPPTISYTNLPTAPSLQTFSPTSQEDCASFCDKHPKPWTKKCSWKLSCSGCSQCDTYGDYLSLQASSNGKEKCYGVMFDIIAVKDVIIVGIDVIVNNNGMKNPITIYTKGGTHEGNEQNPDIWTLISHEEKQNEKQNNNPTMMESINVKNMKNVTILAGSMQSFYVTHEHPQILYGDDGNMGDLYRSNDDMNLFVGSGIDFSFKSPVIRGRSFQGNIYYSLAEESVQRMLRGEPHAMAPRDTKH